MKKTLLLAAALLAVAAAGAGCASHYMVNRPYRLDPCSVNLPQADRLSLGALLMVLEGRRGWTVEEVRPAEGYVGAKVCRGAACILIEFRALAGGQVEARRAPQQFVSRVWARELQRWMRLLDEDFRERRCLPADDLLRKVKQYGG